MLPASAKKNMYKYVNHLIEVYNLYQFYSNLSTGMIVSFFFPFGRFSQSIRFNPHMRWIKTTPVIIIVREVRILGI